jgi:Flp pilus assembly protein CpaB
MPPGRVHHLRRTSRLVLLAGIFLAAITFIVIVLLFQSGGPGTGGGPAATPATERNVVVAVQDIPLGTLVTSAMVTTQKVAITSANLGAFQDPSQIVGQKNTAAISAGQQLTAAMFAQGGTGNIHPDPGKGFRAFAVTVNSNPDLGAVDLVQTGDYVDVIISEDVPVVAKNPDGSITGPPPGVSIPNRSVKLPVLLENIQVIGLIDTAPPAATPAQNGQPAATAAPNLASSKILILAVTPAQAEVLLFARTTGKIDVVYRSAQDTDQVATDGVILKTLIDKYGVLPPNVIVSQLP